MTTETMHPEVAAELAALRQARRELEEERERLTSGAGGEDASIEVALREYETQYFNPSIPSLMNAPCEHVFPDGRTCGLSWKLNNDTIRPVHLPVANASGERHSYRPKQYAANEAPKGKTFQLTQRELTDAYGLSPEPPKAAVDTYLSEKQAAKTLAVTLKVLREMVKAETVVADRIGEVTLIRKESVDRILTLAQMAREAEGYEEDEDA